jgi:hypothetical protein
VRLLTIHPGASYATAEVHNGVVAALRAADVEVRTYDLESRLMLAQRWLEWIWRKNGKPEPKYSDADVAYGASKDAIERALRWEVDGVLVISAMFLHPDILVLLRRAHIPVAVVLTESPYDDAMQQSRVAPFVDLLWTNERTSVDVLRQINLNTHYLPHAYDASVHHADLSRDPSDVPSHDVVFVGSHFDERSEFLAAVDWTGIDLALYGDWRSLPPRHRLRKYIRGGIIDNHIAAQLYRHAKIGLNLYRESMGWGRGAPRISNAESLNPRALELSACGCYQVSQPRAEVGEVFGDNVGTFDSPDELGRLVRYFLSHPEERLERARRAGEAIRGRTFAAMAATIMADAQRVGWPAPREGLRAPNRPRGPQSPRGQEIVSWPGITDAKGASTPPPAALASLSLSPR